MPSETKETKRHLKSVHGGREAKKWVEVDASLVGLSVLSALHKLDHGEEGEADVDIGGRTLRIRFDPLKKRVLMFELKKARTRTSRLRGPGTKTLH